MQLGQNVGRCTGHALRKYHLPDCRFIRPKIIFFQLDKRKYRLALSLALLYLPPDAIAPLVSGALAQSEDHRSSLISFIQAIQKVRF